MSESILNALMHLFAVIATISRETISSSGRKIVLAYLLQHLKDKTAQEYLSLFDNYLDFYLRDHQFKLSEKLPDSSLQESEDLKRICIQIRKELHRNERIIVLLRLIEFVYEDKLISEREREFIILVAHTFNINESELRNALLFVTGAREEDFDQDLILFIDDKDTSSFDELEGAWIDRNRPGGQIQSNRLRKPGLRGTIIILHFNSINIFVFKYIGDQKLLLEGQDVIPERFYILESGSIIRSDHFDSLYYSEIAGRFLHTDKDLKILLNAENIEFRFRNSQNGIHNFNFSEESGQLIGIMGGSGVGKSTLLNLLSGQIQPDRGKITINQYHMYFDRYRLKSYIGFVPQDDLLFEELTVYQNLYYNAKLCFGDYTNNQIERTLFRLLTDLDLIDIKNLKVGNPLNKFISGGQRKRLNIGLELMREPSVLFVDEPTSGLSSMDSENVMNLLKEQTVKGKLVIANIHQPSSNVFKMFDKLWILDKGGYPVYAGNPIDAIIYFKKLSSYADVSEAECSSCGHVNPEQILQILEAKEVDEHGRYTASRKTQPEEWNRHYKENIEAGLERKTVKKILHANIFRIPSIDKQFSVFLSRNLLSKLANQSYILLNLLEAPLLAFILAYFTRYTQGETYIFSENKNLPIYLFMGVIVALFLGLMVSAEEIIRDRKILQRESFLNLSRFSYINSKIAYLFGLSAIHSFLFVLVGNTIIGIKDMLVFYWLVFFSTTCFAAMLGLNISSGLKSAVAIYILIPLLIIPQLLLSGLTVKFDDLNRNLTTKVYVPLIGDLMTSRWAYEALAVEQFKNNRYEKNFYVYDQQISDATYKTSFLIPRLQNLVDECVRKIEESSSDELIKRNLKMIRTGIKNLEDNPQLFPFEVEYLDALDQGEFDDEIATQVTDYLTYARMQYSDVSREAARKKDQVSERIVDSLGSEGAFRLRQDYSNKKLTEYVVGRMEEEKIIQIKDRLIQKKDPIYMIPDSQVGRAHFYAPYKRFNQQLYDTKWFNLSIIWVFSFLLYITLLVDVLRRILDYFDNIRLSRQ
jgi:ABC-type multidrug transport system ATPase subunit